MTTSVFDIWVYLSARPLLWLTVTLIAYVIADAIAEHFNRPAILNPVPMAAGALIIILSVSGTPFSTYFEGAPFIHFLLGPATVALAVPLFQHIGPVRRNLLPMAGALVAGSLTAIMTAMGVAWALSLPLPVIISIAPKSVTTPIAMGIAETLGGIPTLAAVLVILTGILGATLVTPLLNLLRIKDYAARGFAVGIAAHGIGTARAFQVNEMAGAFAGIAMGLNGALTAFLLPLLLWLVL